MLPLISLLLCGAALGASPAPNWDIPPSEGPLRVNVSVHLLNAEWRSNRLHLRTVIRQTWTESRLPLGLFVLRKHCLS